MQATRIPQNPFQLYESKYFLFSNHKPNLWVSKMFLKSAFYIHKPIVLCLSVLSYFLCIDASIMNHPIEQVLSSLICRITTAFHMQKNYPS